MDLSRSMERRFPYAVSAARAITALAGPGDDAFLVTISDKPALKQRSTRNIGSIPEILRKASTGGRTALIDGIYRALHQVRGADNARKALVVISDGGDNHSRYNKAELMRWAVESDAQIYTVSIFENLRDNEERAGVFLLQDLSERTGGLHFTIFSRSLLPEVAEKIGRAMRDVYVLGYKPPGDALPGEWRKVHVKVEAPLTGSVRVTSRSGYYTPE